MSTNEQTPFKKSLTLRVAISLHDENSQTHMSVVGTRQMYERSYTHQILAFAIQLVNELILKEIKRYMSYFNNGVFDNNTETYTHNQLRQLSKNTGVRHERRES